MHFEHARRSILCKIFQKRCLREAQKAVLLQISKINRERPRDSHPEHQQLAPKWYDLFHGATSPPSESDNTATGWKKKAIELAYADVGKVFPTGWNTEVECIKAVQRWINGSSGYFGTGGVRVQAI